MSKQLAPVFRAYVRRQPAPWWRWDWQTRMPQVPHRSNPHEGESLSRLLAMQSAIRNAAFWQPKP